MIFLVKFEFLGWAQYLEKVEISKVESSSFFCLNYVLSKFVPGKSQRKHPSILSKLLQFLILRRWGEEEKRNVEWEGAGWSRRRRTKPEALLFHLPNQNLS